MMVRICFVVMLLFSGSSVSAQVEEPVYTVEMVEKVPEFPGGKTELFRYFRSIKLQEEEIEGNGFSGRLLASFTVKSDGSLSDIKVIRSIGPKTDEEFVKMIEAMPAWIPGEIGGRKVNTLYRLPLQICFR